MPQRASRDGERHTKIVATIGPASWDEPMLTDLLAAGVDVARINCSHSDHESIRRQVSRIRRAAARLGKAVAILLDLQGPKIRVGAIPTPMVLAEDDVLTVVMDESVVGQGRRVGTTYPQMAGDVGPGDRVLFDDGALQGVVERVDRGISPAEVHIRMTVGGALGAFKGLNLPGVATSVPSLTEKDRADLVVGAEVGVDYIALSFVRRADDVLALREALQAIDADIPIIAKIEKPQAVTELDGILEVVEGVMVARGDLGVEVEMELLPVLQKEIIARAYATGAIVITATQMLDSMIRNPRPTRAEATDVANAILDGTDAIMLSGETATGAHPIAAVRMMDRIAVHVETSRFFQRPSLSDVPVPPGAAGTIMRSAVYAANEGARPLVVFTWSGSSAIAVSKGRPAGAVLALTPEQRVVDRLALVWGVRAFRIPPVRSVDDMITAGEQTLLDTGEVDEGEELVILAGKTPMKRATYLLKITEAGRAVD